MRKILGPEFFDRSTLTVARELLGKYLCRRVGGKQHAYMIVETEGYYGFKDQASKARRGKTAGNAPMWGPPGRAYVYFTYGMHWMLNIVTGPKGYPAAVLIRGLKYQGLPLIKLDGPGKLTNYLQIDKGLNGKMLGKGAGLWVEDRGAEVRPSHIRRTPRIGIPNAGAYKDKPWRFVLGRDIV